MKNGNGVGVSMCSIYVVEQFRKTYTSIAILVCSFKKGFQQRNLTLGRHSPKVLIFYVVCTICTISSDQRKYNQHRRQTRSFRHWKSSLLVNLYQALIHSHLTYCPLIVTCANNKRYNQHRRTHLQTFMYVPFL